MMILALNCIMPTLTLFLFSQCTVKFSDKRSQDCTGSEERSKNEAKFSAIAGAIEKLEALHLWDINYEA